MINKAYKFRLYPNKVQQELIHKNLGCARFIYNHILEKSIKSYKTTNKVKYISPASCKAEFEFLKEADSLALCNASLQVKTAYKNFFARQKQKGYKRYTDKILKRCKRQNRKPKLEEMNGFPRFRSRKHNHQAYTTNNQKGSIRIEAGKIKLPKIGFVKLKLHQEVVGLIKSVTVSKTPSDQYYVSILTEQEDFAPLPVIDKKVGIDLGIKSFAVTSDGDVFANPKFLRRTEKQIIKAQQILSRREKGSNNRNKARITLAKLYAKINNQKQDFLHKLSTKIIHENQVIAIEDLSVKNMMQNKDVAKAISEASWYQFRLMLEYTAKWYGRKIIIADKHFPSSQLCHICGYKNPVVKDLGLREWTCPVCHTHHDRDKNAANNLLSLAI